LKKKDQVVFSAFFHDIGKLFERAEDLSGLQEIQKCIKNKFPSGTDNNLINVASHQPSSIEEHIVTKAIVLASSEKEIQEGEQKEKNIHKKTLLEPLLEKISLKSEEEKKTKYRIPLEHLDDECNNIFPQKGTDLGLEGENLLSKDLLEKKYKDLAKEFLQSIEKLPEYKEDSFESLRSLMQSLLSQTERFLISVPTNVSHPDISLFDHLKMTSAIAESLYLYHEHNNKLTEEELKKDEEKFILVCGDFSGIQKFIYNIVSKGAAKSLSGRSLYIQLFCDAVSEWILRCLKLYPNSRIYSSGGKFYLLTSSHFEGELLKKGDELNELLFDEYQGEIHLDISSIKMTENDLKSSKLSEKFEELSRQLNEKRDQRFLSLIKEKPQKFFSPEKVGDKVCVICGSDKEEQTDSSSDTSRNCEKFEKLGREIRELFKEKKSNGLLWLWCKEDYNQIKNQIENNKEKIHEFNFFSTDTNKKNSFFPVFLIVEDINEIKDISFKNSHFEFVNSIQDPEPIQGLSFSHRFLSAPGDLNLDEITTKAKGIKRFGILRMDVDNLGQIFSKGLKNKDEDWGSLSRYASLSRQLNTFFTGYLNVHLLKKEYLKESQLKKEQSEESDCKLIYAGGDDLFAVGPWNEIPCLAHEIQKKFKEYCCYNPDLNLSAGITLLRQKEPILMGANLAGDAEEKAKNFKRIEKDSVIEKQALCFLDSVIGWEEYKEVKSLQEDIKELVEKTKSHALLQVLYSIEREEESLKEGNKEYRLWRHRFVYHISRLLERTKDSNDIKQKIIKLQDLILGKPQEDEKHKRRLEYLYLPVCWTDYLERKEENNKSKTG